MKNEVYSSQTLRVRVPPEFHSKLWNSYMVWKGQNEADFSEYLRLCIAEGYSVMLTKCPPPLFIKKSNKLSEINYLRD